MSPHVIGGLATVALALIGATMVVWPRWWAWFAQLGMYRERPEPSDFYLLSIRLSGVVLVVGGVALASFLFSWQPPAPPSDEIPPAVQEQLDELESDADLVVACLDLRPLFEEAVVVDETGAVVNVDELETLATENGAAVRAMGESITTSVIVKVDGVSLFAVPTPADRHHCAELQTRLLTD